MSTVCLSSWVQLPHNPIVQYLDSKQSSVDRYDNIHIRPFHISYFHKLKQEVSRKGLISIFLKCKTNVEVSSWLNRVIWYLNWWDQIVLFVFGIWSICSFRIKITPDINPTYVGIERSFPDDSKNVSFVDMGRWVGGLCDNRVRFLALLR